MRPTSKRRFFQVDVFAGAPFGGNPVAVVLDADGLDSDEMQNFARWTNLSETTFVLAPQDRAAHYKLRIFTTDRELPFAGHPTLGSCHAWIESRGDDDMPDTIVQECGAGLVQVRRSAGALSFAGPPLVRYGPVEEALVCQLARELRIARDEIVDSRFVDNGPGWIGILLESPEAVKAVRPGQVEHEIGLVGPYEEGPFAFEVRAFFPAAGATTEDPVTGSLNASLAHWLLETGRASSPYCVSQGTVIGRAGRVEVSRDESGEIWVGGTTTTRIAGTIEL